MLQCILNWQILQRYFEIFRNSISHCGGPCKPLAAHIWRAEYKKEPLPLIQAPLYIRTDQLAYLPARKNIKTKKKHHSVDTTVDNNALFQLKRCRWGNRNSITKTPRTLELAGMAFPFGNWPHFASATFACQVRRKYPMWMWYQLLHIYTEHCTPQHFFLK